MIRRWTDKGFLRFKNNVGYRVDFPSCPRLKTLRANDACRVIDVEEQGASDLNGNRLAEKLSIVGANRTFFKLFFKLLPSRFEWIAMRSGSRQSRDLRSHESAVGGGVGRSQDHMVIVIILSFRSVEIGKAMYIPTLLLNAFRVWLFGDLRIVRDAFDDRWASYPARLPNYPILPRERQQWTFWRPFDRGRQTPSNSKRRTVLREIVLFSALAQLFLSARIIDLDKRIDHTGFRRRERALGKDHRLRRLRSRDRRCDATPVRLGVICEPGLLRA